MKCPVCQEMDLVISERQGVEIDYCPQCRGVWLDRGELDKLIERSQVWETNRPIAALRHADTNYDDYDDDDDEYYYDERLDHHRLDGELPEKPKRGKPASGDLRRPRSDRDDRRRDDKRDDKRRDEKRDDKRDDKRDAKRRRRKKRSSFLEELFDFDLFD